VLEICGLAEVGGQIVGGAADAGVNGLAGAISDALTWVVQNTVTWWVKIPTTDPAGSGNPAVREMRGFLQAITVAVAVGGMTTAGIRMAVTRRPDPLIGVGRGLAVVAVTGALGVLLPSALLRAGDEYSDWVINRAVADGDIGGRLATVMGLGQGVPAGVVIVLGIIAILAGFVQAVLMMFRQASVLILTGALQLAAAGQFVEATRPWFRRVTGWMLALICYKPAAATVYAAAFTLAGQGQDPTTMIVGFCMILLSLVALPVLVRLFTWATGSAVAQATGGGTAAVSAAAYGLAAAGALRSRAADGAADHAQYLSQQIGSQASATTAPGSGAVTPPPPAPAASPRSSTAGGSTEGGSGSPGAAVRVPPGSAPAPAPARAETGAGATTAGPAAAAAGAAAEATHAARSVARGTVPPAEEPPR